MGYSRRWPSCRSIAPRPGWGRRAWNALPTVGSLYLWGAFLNAFLVRVRHAPGYWLAVVAMALRIIAWARRRGRR
jgi:hypothetical protein